MQKTTFSLLIILSLLTHGSLKSQIVYPLPYSNNFEDSLINNTWSVFDNNSIPKPWILNSTYQNDLTTFSNCMYASNDYVWSPVLLTEWLITPAIDFSNGGFINLKAKVASPNHFGATSTLQPNFYIGIYLLQGSNNPDSANIATEISNITNTFSGNDDIAFKSAIWKEISNIPVLATNQTSYIAFKYQVQDTGLSFHVYIDDVTITKNATLNLTASLSSINSMNVFPNPSTSFFWITLNTAEGINKISLVDDSGQTIFEKKFKNSRQEKIDISEFAKGIYLLSVNNSTSQKIMIE